MSWSPSSFPTSWTSNYISKCPAADLAPAEYGGNCPPYTKMMALIAILYRVYQQKKAEAKARPGEAGSKIPAGLLTPAGEIALRRIAATTVADRWDKRLFACTLTRSLNRTAELNMYAETKVGHRNWLRGLTNLQVSGIEARISMTGPGRHRERLTK